MAKTHKNRKNMIRRITKTTSRALPIVNKGLETVGKAATNIAEKSIPVVEKGISTVYGTMATGFDLGIKGIAKNIPSTRHTSSKGGRRHRRSKSRSRRHR
jgi:hypothetical protein